METAVRFLSAETQCWPLFFMISVVDNDRIFPIFFLFSFDFG